MSNSDNVRIETQSLDSIDTLIHTILFIPGGMGTRKEINNLSFIEKIKSLAQSSEYVLTVCTGSALLAKTGLLDSLKATSNKRSFEWVKSCNKNVHWISKARWVVDGKFYTSSGISAGIDMALDFVSDRFGKDLAIQIAKRTEYRWNEDRDNDEFGVL